MPVAAIKDDDKGIRRLVDDLRFIVGHALTVGIVEDPDPESKWEFDVQARSLMRNDDGEIQDITVAEVANIHVNGLGAMPVRDFVSQTFRRDMLAIENRVGIEFNAMLGSRLPGSGKRAAKRLGRFISGRMRFTLENQDGILPLSQGRLDEKKRRGKSHKALINWRLLINSIRYKVSRS